MVDMRLYMYIKSFFNSAQLCQSHDFTDAYRFSSLCQSCDLTDD